MKLMSKKLVLSVALLLPLSANVLADDADCPSGKFVNTDAGFQCVAELPEPSTPLLLLGAAGVAIAARAIHKRKK